MRCSRSMFKTVLGRHRLRSGPRPPADSNDSWEGGAEVWRCGITASSCNSARAYHRPEKGGQWVVHLELPSRGRALYVTSEGGKRAIHPFKNH